MKIAVFAYNFLHKKTQDVLCHLFLNNIEVNHIFAANKVKLNIKPSKEKISIADLRFVHPKIIAKRINSKYTVISHSSDRLVNTLSKEKFDLGIIAGARILDQKIINKFKIGVLNMHPGILPENRGLDTHKWAILKNWPQGVTGHLIDSRVDLGKLVYKKNINVFEDDSLVDINYRLQNCELEVMIKSIDILKRKANFKFINPPFKNLHSTIDNINENKMKKIFNNYKAKYKNLV